jgi:hypothetical protein
MGAPWYRSVTQWSNGAYAGATNQEDDLSILAGMLGWATDEHGDASHPTDLDGLEAHGVIGRSDQDAVRFHHAGGTLELRVDPYVCEQGTCGGNLDVHLELRSAQGDLLLVSDPSESTSATIQQQLAAGDYVLVVSGAASANAPAYGSLGQWSLNGGAGVLTTSGRPSEVRDGSGTPEASPAGGDGGGCGFGGIAGLLLGFVGLALRRR